MIRFFAFVLLLTHSAMATPIAPAPTPAPAAQTENPQAQPYDPARNASADVDAVLARAAISHKRIIIVMGANWCHDSKALAGWFGTARFQAMIAAKYELVYEDVGTPQIGQGRNLDIGKRYGVKIKNTPTVFVLSSEGKRLNSKDDARSWRNASSRSENAIFEYFDHFAG